jgi:hypothetical protein
MGLKVDKNDTVRIDVILRYCDVLRKNDARITKVHSKYYHVPDVEYVQLSVSNYLCSCHL